MVSTVDRCQTKCLQSLVVSKFEIADRALNTLQSSSTGRLPLPAHRARPRPPHHPRPDPHPGGQGGTHHHHPSTTDWAQPLLGTWNKFVFKLTI